MYVTIDDVVAVQTESVIAFSYFLLSKKKNNSNNY